MSAHPYATGALTTPGNNQHVVAGMGEPSSGGDGLLFFSVASVAVAVAVLDFVQISGLIIGMAVLARLVAGGSGKGAARNHRVGTPGRPAALQSGSVPATPRAVPLVAPLGSPRLGVLPPRPTPLAVALSTRPTIRIPNLSPPRRRPRPPSAPLPPSPPARPPSPPAVSRLQCPFPDGDDGDDGNDGDGGGGSDGASAAATVTSATGDGGASGQFDDVMGVITGLHVDGTFSDAEFAKLADQATARLKKAAAPPPLASPLVAHKSAAKVQTEGESLLPLTKQLPRLRLSAGKKRSPAPGQAQSPSPAAVPAAAAAAGSHFEEVTRSIDQLRDSGSITETEFQVLREQAVSLQCRRMLQGARSAPPYC